MVCPPHGRTSVGEQAVVVGTQVVVAPVLLVDDQQPPFAVCFDCDAHGLTALKFASLLPGRVKGHPLTGAGTCVECASHDRDGVNR